MAKFENKKYCIVNMIKIQRHDPKILEYNLALIVYISYKNPQDCDCEFFFKIIFLRFDFPH